MMDDGGTQRVADRGLSARQWLKPVAALNRNNDLAAHLVLPEPTEIKAPVQERWAVPLGNYRLLVNVSVDCELSEWLPLCAVPNTPAWIIGAVNLRGTLVPVFDLHPLSPTLFAEQGNTRRTKRLLFIVGTGERAAAMTVEGLPYRQRMDDEIQETRVPDLPEALAAKVSAAYRRSDVWWLDCDLSGLLRELGEQAGNG